MREKLPDHVVGKLFACNDLQIAKSRQCVLGDQRLAVLLQKCVSGSGSALHGTVLGENVADPVEVLLLAAVLGQYQQIFAGAL